MFRYEIGDIVWVQEMESDKTGNHWYIVIGDDGNIVPLDYLGFLISSNKEKNKENSNYIFNESIKTKGNGNVTIDGHAKCDELYNIPEKEILYKIGKVDKEDLERLLDAYNNYLETV